MAQRQAAQFERASFDPHALDERWEGLRWIGGWGGSNGETTQLELGHGENPYDPKEPQVRVATHHAPNENGQAMAWGNLAQEHVNLLWNATGTLDAEVRSAAYPLAYSGRDPTEPWDTVLIPLDRAEIQFRVLSARGHWFAQARHRDFVISVTASLWPVDRTGLVSVSDVSEYIVGSDEMRRRAQEDNRDQ
jgi:hypothetical protein